MYISLKIGEGNGKGFRIIHVGTFATNGQVLSAALFWGDATGGTVVESGLDVVGGDVDVVAAVPIVWDGTVIVSGSVVVWDGMVVAPAFAVAWANADILLATPAIGDGVGKAPAFPDIREEAAIVTLVSGKRPEMKVSTLEGNGESDA